MRAVTACVSVLTIMLAAFPARAADIVTKATVTWYGEPHHGNPMRGGKRPGCKNGIFNKNDPTLAAASDAFPFGSRWRLHRNGRSQDIVVCDRGKLGYPHFDISEAAAIRLGIRGAGRIRDMHVERLQ